MAQKIFFVFLLLAIVFEEGTSLTCYNCTFSNHAHNACADPERDRDGVVHKECHEGESCVVYTTKNPTTGSTATFRTCSSKDICNTLTQHETDYIKLLDCQVCNTDLCNTGKTISTSVIILLLFLILASFIA